MKPQTEKTYRYRILKVQLFIQEHLDEELSLDELARQAHFSSYHFHRIFRGLVGESVAEYVRRLRMEAAASLLWSTEQTVTQVSLEVGYQAPEAFSRTFRQHFGVSPSQYREQHEQHLYFKELPGMTDSTETYAVKIETPPARKVAFLRHVGSYTECGPMFQKLMQWAFSNNIMKQGTQLIGVSHDDPDVTDESKIRFDCCVTVDDSFAGEGDIQVQTIEGGEYAILTHQGPYTELAPAYRWLFGVWLPASGREARNLPPYEIYHNNPQEVPPEELLTDIYVPLV